MVEVFFGRDPLATAITQLLTSPEDYERYGHPHHRHYGREHKGVFNPLVDVKELPNSYVFQADVPGLKTGDIKVQIEQENVMTIGGERKREEPSEEVKFLRIERPAGKFNKKFTLPSNAKVDAVEAKCADGVLTITIPKVPPPEPVQPKTIEVTSG